jgi:PAS domain S-box-containing protein
MSIHDRTERTAGYVFILIFAIMAMGIVLIGYLHYLNYEQDYRVEMENELSSIAELKVGELVLWRKERLGDGAVLFKNATFSALARRFLDNPGDTDAQRQLQDWMGKYLTSYQYTRVYLVDTQGRVKMSVPQTPEAHSSVARNVTGILRSGKVAIEDFHRNTPDGPIHLAVVVPIYDSADDSRPLGVLALHIDPAIYLYAFISRWPTPSQTAETLLVRRDGDDVLFLSELRFHKNAPLNMRIPLTKTEVPAVRAALGQTGIFEGVDYRDAPVIAAVKAVPGSPWFLLARMNTSEVYAPMREHLWEMAMFVGVLLFGSGAAMGFVWRRKSARYRERDKVAEAIRESEARFRQLAEATFEGVIVTESGRILDVNKSFLEMFGYEKAEEVVGRSPLEFVAPEYRELAAGHIAAGYDKPYEIMTIRKDGSHFPIEVHGRTMEIEGRRVRITAARDMTERKKAEQALAESESRFREIFNTVNDAIFIHDAETGRIIDVNRRMCEMYGFTREEALACGPDDLSVGTPPYSSAEAIQKIRLAHTEGPQTFDWLARTRDGRLFWVGVSLRLALIGSQLRILAVVRDVTERKRAEQALKESEEKFRALFEEMVSGFALNKMVFDEQGQPADYITVEVNHEFERILNATRESVVGKKAYETVPGLDRKWLDIFGEVERTGTPLSYVEYVSHLDKWLEGTVFRVQEGLVAGTFIDITERKKAEEEKQEALNRIQKIASRVPGVVYQFRARPDGSFCFPYASDAIRDIARLNPEDVREDASKAFAAVHPDDFGPLMASVQASARDLTPWQYEFRMKFDDGEERWLFGNGIPEREADGGTLWHGVITDVTERKKAEIELRQAKEQAEAATKLKDQFVSLVAHDLRSPFASMMELLRIFVERKSLLADGEDKKILDSVFNSGDRMLAMIEDLLKTSRLQTGQITPQPRFFKGHMAAAVTIGSLSHLASQKGIVIMNDVPLDMRLYADQSLFDEVLLNLLSNAIKFCSSGDKITIFIPPGLKSAIAVRDNGKGINEAAIPSLFKHEVKTTTSGTAGEMGTGLGLPYSYDIMRAHGGDITVESAPGKGAVFTARLPYVKPVALVVDDERTVRMLARIQLEKIGIDVVEAVDGATALSAIKERRPHIVITDINMPGMDGFELLGRLKQDIPTREIPVIVITAMEAETRENAFRHGADDFVRKPIEAEDFIPRVRRFVG